MNFIVRALLAGALIAPAAAAQHEGSEAGSHELHQSMTKGSQEMQSMEMSGDLDRDFVEGMLMHHRHGVEMARIQAAQGRDAKAKEFAKKVIENQSKEIRQLESWLKAHPEDGDSRRR